MVSGSGYSSSGVLFSSIAISRNSLDSKTSPHSLHSTYSVSSSRETISTCGCLHFSRRTLGWVGCEGWLGVIRLAKCSFSSGILRNLLELAVFWGGPFRMSSPQVGQIIWPSGRERVIQDTGEYNALGGALNRLHTETYRSVPKSSQFLRNLAIHWFQQLK